MSFTITPAPPDERLNALRLLFAEYPDGEQRAVWCQDALASNQHDASGLLVARSATGQLCGVTLVQPMPGALGVVWPPCGETAAIRDALATAGNNRLRASGAKVCQAFAAVGEAAPMAPLARTGFRHVTQLVFLGRTLPGLPLPEPRFRLTFVADAPPFSEAFRAALLATHEGTLDCPELNAGRTAGDLLAGFSSAGPGVESYLAIHEGTPVGVVMFAHAEASGAAELSYLGVVPAARGRGLGGDLVKFAIAEASRVRALAVTLSVDARNEPALRLYRRHGFVEVDRREVWLAHLGGELRGGSPS